MTTTDAAAAQRHSLAVALAVGIGLLSLTGCGGTPSLNLFGSSASNPQPEPVPTAAVAEQQIAKVAINPIVGPPDALGRQLQQEFTSALEKQRVGVTQGKDDPADFHLRPYILAAKEKHGTKVSYVLDVSEASGRRVNRFAGEEIIAASPSQDPWAAITPAVAETLAAKATSAFVAWVPNARTSGAIAEGPAGVGAVKTADASRSAVRPAAKKPVALASASGQTTGSITRGGLTALVPSVTGAPGDGGTSLTAAIQRQLQGRGIALSDRPVPGAYRVEGAVMLGDARGGKQPIQIEWVVRDPNGKKLGTVSQKNDIPEGSLDGPWGRVADQAAGAAVQGILKLLPNAGQG